MENIDKLKKSMNVSNDTRIEDIVKMTGVSRMGLFRWNKSGKAPATLKSFLLGTKYRHVSNDTSDKAKMRFQEWKEENPKATFMSVDTVESIITGS